MPIVVKTAKTTQTTEVVSETLYATEDLLADIESLREEQAQMDALKEEADKFLEKMGVLKLKMAEREKRIACAVEDKCQLPPAAGGWMLVNNWKVEVSAKGMSRKITNMAAVFTKLGKEMFLQLAKVNLTDLDKYMTEPERDKVCEKSYEGARRLKISKFE